MPIGNMQLFVGTKTVKATPLNRVAYNLLRGWTVPADEDPMDPGYLVEYQDGGAPNMKGFDGYISWSPKDAFEKAYRLCETVEQRITNEHTDLKSNLEKLEAFIKGPQFSLINEVQQHLLWQQHRAMAKYLGILELRLEDLNK